MTNLGISDCHTGRVEERPPHQLVYKLPLMSSNLRRSHLFILGRVEEHSLGGCRVENEISIFCIPVGQEIVRFLFQTHKHPNYLFIDKMLHCIDQIEVSVNERLDHLTTLLLDSQQLGVLIKDQQRKRSLVKSFRIVKQSEKARIANEGRYLKQLEKMAPVASKAQIIACERMLANCINQYLNSDYEVKKTGQPSDLIDIFLFYYQQIKATARCNQLTVVRNCNLFQETKFMYEHLAFLLSNMQTTLNHVYQNEKNRFFNLDKAQSRNLSPEKKDQEEQEKFDVTGKLTTKEKKKLQQYCFDLSKLLGLESIYINYFYFNSIDIEKRKKTLVSNFLKRNVHVKRVVISYENEYRVYKEKLKK